MNVQGFKEKMAQYKKAKVENPLLKYWDWKKENDLQYQLYRAKLPENLRTETDSYNLYGAYQANMQPELSEDGFYHLGSRNPETGEILKSKNHPTYKEAIESEINAGYFPYEKNGKTYTKTYSPIDISGYADGTDGIKGDMYDYTQDIKIPTEKLLDLWDLNHTDINTDTVSPFYDRISDTYGTVNLPDVEVSAPLTWEASNKQAARRGANAAREGLSTAFKVAAPIVGGAGLAAMSGAGLLSTAINPIDVATIAVNPTLPLNYIPFIPNFVNKFPYVLKPKYNNRSYIRLVGDDAIKDMKKTGLMRSTYAVDNEKNIYNEQMADFLGYDPVGLSKKTDKRKIYLFDKKFSDLMFYTGKPFYGDKRTNYIVTDPRAITKHGELANEGLEWIESAHKGHSKVARKIAISRGLDPDTSEGRIVVPLFNGNKDIIPVSEFGAFDLYEPAKAFGIGLPWYKHTKYNSTRLADGKDSNILIPKYADGTGRINPWSNVSERDRLEKYETLNPVWNYDITSFLAAMLTTSGIAKRTKGPNEDENRWKAYLGLPYDKLYVPDSNIRFENDYKYPNRLYTGLSKDAKNEIRKKIIPKSEYISAKYPEKKNNWILVTNKKARSEDNPTIIRNTRLDHTGDLASYGIRENNGSGIYEIGDMYDFPWYIPIPNRNKGTELMVRDTVWSNNAKPELYIPRSNKNNKSN